MRSETKRKKSISAQARMCKSQKDMLEGETISTEAWHNKADRVSIINVGLRNININKVNIIVSSEPIKSKQITTCLMYVLYTAFWNHELLLK